MRRLGLACIGLAALLLVAGAPPSAEEDGAGRSLAGDDRVGTVVDLQGRAFVRPVDHTRWSLLSPRSVLLPGDLVRTPVRGAHAVEIRLAKGGAAVLGPGTLAEFVAPDAVRLLRGEAEARGPQETPLRVTGPGEFAASAAAPLHLRTEDRKTVVLSSAPRWLVGYRSSTTDEWMGSLVARVDGRDTPLSVGYHKVDVVIRDQIARTTVEQSFVNHTSLRLEGVFTFPLPADASISGFGMWIGGELVEADIVERQRAREIYEDILRRRKDPGLLEWSGGNLFKASVFPIDPGESKRIRIRYTQVLPLEGATYRYRYALRSELLRGRPLRDLRVKVSVHSTTPIASVDCPTHETRRRRTETVATVEYDAQEVRPDRDLEVAVTLERPPPLTVIPHRRGEDGYFMLLLSPPDEEAGGWRRDLVPEGESLDLLIVADTSGSMDEAARATQAAFLDALLSLLGPADSFRLLACDVGVHAFLDAAVPPTEENATAALDFLASRVSLGWSDLDLALAEAAKRATAGTHVVYLGDGIGTTADADPIALARRIRKLGRDAKGTFHAVSTGSAYEKGVLEAIASLGGGSVRAAGNDPARTASRWIVESAQPSLKDLAVRVDGLRTARVYPTRLPNLAAGTQQVVLGRFLPDAGATEGTVTVTGTRAGKPVRYTAPFRLAAGEEGNSFLPRLWARRHLDSLLAEGRGPDVREEIVTFSERFGIITPFTSFLVLESDEDRERYGVGRRVAMRDGERFFAEAKDAARTGVLREQMRLARAWRSRLRARMRAEIAGLGRGLLDGTVGGYAYARGAPIGIGGGAGGESSRGDGFSDVEVRDSLDEISPPSEGGTPTPPPGDDDDFDAPLGPPAALEPVFESRPGGARSSGFRAGERLARGLDMRLPGKPYAGRSASLSTGRVGFPGLAAPPRPEAEVPAPEWPEEVLVLLAALDRIDSLAALTGGLEIETASRSFHPLRADLTARSSSKALLSKDAWHVRRANRGREPTEEWLADGVRGTLAVAARLGRRRPAEPSEREFWRTVHEVASPRYARGYRGWTARIESRADDRVTIRLVAPAPSSDENLLVIDTVRHVVLRSTTIRNGKPTWVRIHSEFVEVGGLWWGTRLVTTDGDGHVTSRAETRVVARTAAEIAAAMRTATAAHGDVLFLAAEDPDLAAAKQAVHEGRGRYADHLVIALHHESYQRRTESLAALREAEALAAGKPGVAWIRARFLARSRRGEELKAHLLGLAARVRETKGPEGEVMGSWLCDLAAGTFTPAEHLVLLDALRDEKWTVDDDVTPWDLHWFQRRLTFLTAAGRSEEARALAKRLVEVRPDDPRILRARAEVLLPTDPDEAFALLTAAARREDRWLDGEASNLLSWWADQLGRGQRIEEMLPVVKRWVARAAEWQLHQACERLLAVLDHLGREEEVESWLDARFREGLGEPGDGRTANRLQAAVGFVLGDRWYGGHGLPHRRRGPDPAWEERLGELATRLVRRAGGVGLATRILRNHWFARTDTRAEIVKSLREDLAATGAIETMDLGCLSGIVHLLPWGRADASDELWRDAKGRLRMRWRATEDAHERRIMTAAVLQLLDARGAAAEAIDLLRERLGRVEESEKPQVARQLMTRLASRPWSKAVEEELIALRPRLIREKAEEDERRWMTASTVRWIAARLFAMRVEAGLGPVDERESWPRKKLWQKSREAKAESRRGLATRFAAAVKTADAVARPWFEIERLGFAVEMGDDLGAVEAEARELLLGLPAADPGVTRILRERALLVLAYAACRRNAPDGLADRTLELMRAEAARVPDAADWRYGILRLLVALDRVEALDAALRSWTIPGRVESRWRLARGYLLAETGKLREAAALFEEVARLGELTDSGHAALAQWYFVLEEEDRRAAAIVRRYAALPEHALQRQVRDARHRVRRNRRGEVPDDLDPEVFHAIRELLSRSADPARHVGILLDLYRTTKDFRLLAALADGVVGHTPQGIYPFLEKSWDILRQVHEEATCDEIAARLAVRAAGASGATDRRALGLLLAFVERRAAEVLDQPGPHAAAALTALRDAFPPVWRPGERRLLADLLASLGRVPDEAFAAEQLRQLETLHRIEVKGSTDRLRIADALARTRWAYDEHATAMDRLASALDEHRESHQGKLPPDANDVVDHLMTWCEERGLFGRAETFLVEERARQGDARAVWYGLRLHETYVRCLERSGTVARGQGEVLYGEVRPLLLADLGDRRPGDVSPTIDRICRLHRAAHAVHEVASAGKDLVRFSRTELLPALSCVPTTEHAESLKVAETLAAIESRLAAVTFLVERLEAEPDRRRRDDLGAWPKLSRALARGRASAGDLGDLEPRLLAVVIRELRHDLRSLQPRSRRIYAHGHEHYFWTEKLETFATVARGVIEANQASPSRILHAANYLSSGLRLQEEAIDVLVAADARGALREDGRWTLAGWLQSHGRYEESVPHLETLVGASPDRPEYRLRLIVGYHETGRDDDGRALADDSADRLRLESSRLEWQTGSLAETCLDCGYHARSVALYDEAIALRSRANRGARRDGDNRLASYHAGRGRALLALGRVDEAVDATTNAVAALRRGGDGMLESLLGKVEDLDGYAARWVSRVEETGLDAAVIRKALGVVYLHQDAGKAVPHLLAARDLRPEDPEIHKRLISAYDRLNDAESASRARLESLGRIPDDLSAYADLGERLSRLGREEEAERAYTTLVERAPNEADGHQRLASVRRRQKRHDDEVEQWRQVVRIRSGDPQGWFSLFDAQERAGQSGAARRTLEEMIRTTWDPRHGKVRARAAELLEHHTRTR